MTKVFHILGGTLPESPLKLRGAARSEWKRVAATLFQMQRLDVLSAVLLAVYCSTYARCKASRASSSAKQRSHDLRELRACARLFGYRLDQTGKIDLAHPLSLDHVAIMEQKKRARQQSKLLARATSAGLPEWLTPPLYLDAMEFKEYFRVAPVLVSKNRLLSDSDQKVLLSYCSAFRRLYWARRVLKFNRQIRAASKEMLRSQNEFDDCRRQIARLARELGGFCESSRLNTETIAKRQTQK
jgi:phage terminase small subunit